MKSFPVLRILGSTIALLGSPGVQAAAKSGHNFAAVTSTLTAFGMRFSTSPAISSPSTTTVIAATAINIFQNQVSTSVVVELTRTRTSTISITLSRTLSATEVDLPTSSMGILSTSALVPNEATIPLVTNSIHSLVPSPTSSAFSKQAESSPPHPGIFVSLLSSVHSTVVLPVNSLSEILPTTSSDTATTASQLPNPLQNFGLSSPSSSIDEFTISSRSTVFITIYPSVTHTFTVTTYLQLSDPSSSGRNNSTAPSMLNILALASSPEENTTLTRILSTAGDAVMVLSLTNLTSSLSPSVQSLLFGHSLTTLSSKSLPPSNNKSTYTGSLFVTSATIFSSILSSNLPLSNTSTYTKFLTVPSTTITLQSIPTTAVALNISAPRSSSSSSSSSSPVSIFRGIFRNILHSSTRADPDDSPPPPSNNTINNAPSSVLPNKRSRIMISTNNIEKSERQDVQTEASSFLAPASPTTTMK